MTDAVTIRPATMEDAAALAAVLTSVGIFERVLPDGERARTERVAQNLHALVGEAGHDTLVADVDGRGVAGFLNMHRHSCLMFDGEEGYISELFIHAECTGMGIGGALIAEAERLARERGWWRLSLINSRDRESYRRGFYAAQGWEERPLMANFVLMLKE